MAWNPEQNFGNGENNIHLQCRKNIRPIDDALKERLKSVSLVITTLLISLHDTTIENLNKRLLQLIVQGQGYSRENWQERDIYS